MVLESFESHVGQGCEREVADASVFGPLVGDVSGVTFELMRMIPSSEGSCARSSAGSKDAASRPRPMTNEVERAPAVPMPSAFTNPRRDGLMIPPTSGRTGRQVPSSHL